jgi:glycosyltransferase involved in cell wall biosynthesis
MNPLISVICPTYHAAAYVEKTAGTILCQTLVPHEVIFSDDGSADDTVGILRKMEQKFNERGIEFAVLENSHQGPGAARNAGLNVAKGDWIAFLDADDAWLPEKIERITKTIMDNPEANFFSHWEEYVGIAGERQVLRNGSSYNPKRCLAPQIYGANHFSTSAVVCRKSLVVKWNGFDNSYPASQDYELWLRLSEDIRLVVLPEVLGRYVEMPGSITAQPYYRRLLPLLKILIRHRDKAGAALFWERIARVLLSTQWLRRLHV